MTTSTQTRVHFICGGFPRGSAAGHDMDYARLRILQMLQDSECATTTVAADYAELGEWLSKSDLLVTYVAGPYPNEEQVKLLSKWLEGGGRWLALHGTSGGRAVPLPDGAPGRAMSKASHHQLLGAFFLNHPPIRKFTVDVCDRDHPLTRGLPDSFEVMDELYLLELEALDQTRVLLTTSDLSEQDPAPRTFGFTYGEDTSVGADGVTRTLAYVCERGAGAVAYIGLGHCHTPSTNIQPWVHESVAADGKTPLQFRGPWESEAFSRLLENGVQWGLEARRAS